MNPTQRPAAPAWSIGDSDGGHTFAVTGAATNLDALAARVEWPDAEAAASARSGSRPGQGRLDEVREWLAAARGGHPAPPLTRPRCVVVGPGQPASELAESLEVGVRTAEPPAVADALEAGLRLADDEVDSGTDLLIVAAGGSSPAHAVVVSLLTSAEPIALLPRGAAATDTAAWITHAAHVRDTRRAVAGLRRDPAELLVRLGDAQLALTTGLVLQAVVRRTPLILDGTSAVVAGLLIADLVSRASRWWQVADVSPDPVHTRAVAEFDQSPLLNLQITSDDGTAGLLTVAVVRAAGRVQS